MIFNGSGYPTPTSVPGVGTPHIDVTSPFGLQQAHRQALANAYAQHQLSRAVASGLYKMPVGASITDPAALWRAVSAQLFTNNPANVNTFLGRVNPTVPVVNPANPLGQ